MKKKKVVKLTKQMIEKKESFEKYLSGNGWTLEDDLCLTKSIKNTCVRIRFKSTSWVLERRTPTGWAKLGGEYFSKTTNDMVKL